MSTALAELDVVPTPKRKIHKINKKKAKGRKASGARNSARFNMNDLTISSLPSDTDKKLVTQAAIKHSLAGGSFIDTKFYAFSRKRASGVVDTPKAVYANSAILSASSKYFDGLLGGMFRESADTFLDAPFAGDRDSFTHEYEYLSDSDLDSEEEDIADSQPSEEVNVEQCNEGVVDTSKVKATSQFCLQAVTVIFYLYTEEVAFAPLKSQNVQSTQSSDPSSLYEAPLCSPKSMYRIADKYDLDELKTKALDDIKAKLTAENIVEELFSTVTSM
ncbi:hypothetical protein EIP86_000959 [Pleurotus ostreatoroseus]|nr:hypothetical protein EIP86_000959 [Pleurotus ostreatoroseus]